LSRPGIQVFRTSTPFWRAPIHPRPTFAYSLPSGARIPVPEQAPDINIPDATLLDLEASTQPDSVILGTQSRYSATETSSNENYVLTATDEPYSRQFSHASGSAISDDDHKPGLSLASYENQDQRTFEPLSPSIFVSWPEPRPHVLHLPAQIKSSANEELGSLDILDKEISRPSLSRIVPTQKGEDYDQDWEGTLMLTQHDSQFVPSSTHSWTSVDTQAGVQRSTKTDQSTTSLSTSTQRIQEDPAISRINWSMQMPKQGIELILGSVVGGSLVFVSIVLLHRLVLQFLCRRIERLQPPLAQRKNPPSRRKSGTHAAEIAEVSHFSMES